MRISKSIISALSVTLLSTSFIGVTNVHASTLSTTPMLGNRYSKQTANYQDLSTSTYYKEVWKTATKAWTKKGFVWTKAKKSKTTLSSYDGGTNNNLAGVAYINHDKQTGHIFWAKVRINRAAFKKYGYTKAQRVNVAEHELGHTLGLAHNKAGSTSVMNPSNRYFGIQKCDVKGMIARYRSSIAFDTVPNTKLNDPANAVTSVYYIKATPKISKLKVTYSSKKHAVTIKGHVKGVKKLLLNYKGKKIANVKTKAGKFVITKRFKGYGTFKLLNGSTVIKSINANKYATKKPVIKKATRTKKGIHYTVIGNKNATTDIYKNGKYLMSITAWDTNQTKFYLNNSKIKNSSKNLTITQKIAGKKTSSVVKLPALHVSAEYNTIY
ncbi:peptidase M10 [Lactiplantibacillus garii]|uniref:Peptidase M10 n=1 Tax=Lactiplantibacillus garii TaxID=2306423 RepID=A0A426D3M0_9LACO|nr:matrixin family metalloprotease [Lactiplantibacillus garii]RRK09172.1 peptidase M10 [Lactiplantibacillus garii]